MSEEYGLKFVVNGEDYDKIKKSLNEQIEDLQQKVEQLEKENKELNRFCELYVQSLYNADLTKAEKKVEQLENIRKEVIEYIKDNACYSEGHCKCSFSQIALDNLLNILNKGENNE